MVIERKDLYFTQPGEQNTEQVIKAVVERVEQTGINCVVVASHSGRTALRFAKALKGKAKVICVSSNPARKRKKKIWPIIDLEVRKELESLGVTIIERAHNIFDDVFLEDSRKPVFSVTNIIREVYYTLGQGFKVAVEVALMAVVSGYIEPYQDIISVGGTTQGSDTALIIKPVYPQTFFSNSFDQRLEIREIIAMPRVKK
ncbi:MAG: pyruvate kinase alpha/beta domain-containing protein [Nitrososphaeria archaeon]